MRTVSPSQMRSTNLTLIGRSDARKLGVRESEFDLMREHVEAQNKLLRALEDHPEILDLLREKIMNGRRPV